MVIKIQVITGKILVCRKVRNKIVEILGLKMSKNVE